MSQKFRRFKNLSEFDGKRIRIISKYGDEEVGEASWFSSGFGEAELGCAEQGLEVNEFVFFIKDIKSIELCK